MRVTEGWQGGCRRRVWGVWVWYCQCQNPQTHSSFVWGSGFLTFVVWRATAGRERERGGEVSVPHDLPSGRHLAAGDHRHHPGGLMGWAGREWGRNAGGGTTRVVERCCSGCVYYSQGSWWGEAGNAGAERCGGAFSSCVLSQPKPPSVAPLHISVMLCCAAVGRWGAPRSSPCTRPFGWRMASTGGWCGWVGRRVVGWGLRVSKAVRWV